MTRNNNFNPTVNGEVEAGMRTGRIADRMVLSRAPAYERVKEPR